MKNKLYILLYAKGTSQAEAMSNSGGIKTIALAVIKLLLSEESVGWSFSQSVSQSVIQSVIVTQSVKFHEIKDF